MKVLAPVEIEAQDRRPPAGRSPAVRVVVAFAAGTLLGAVLVAIRGAEPAAGPAGTAPPVPASDVLGDATTTPGAAGTQEVALADVMRNPTFNVSPYEDGDTLVLPLTFPDGSGVEVVYEAAFALDGYGILAETGGHVSDGPPREIVLVPAPADAIAWDAPAVAVYPRPDGEDVAVHEASGGFWLVFPFGSWTGLVADPGTDAERQAWADGLTSHTTAAGLPVLEAAGSVTLSAPGDAEGPSLRLGGRSADAIVVRSAPCPAEAIATLCFPDIPVVVQVAGGDAFFAAAASALGVRAYTPPPSAALALPALTGPGALVGSVEVLEMANVGSDLVAVAAVDEATFAVARSGDGAISWSRESHRWPEGVTEAGSAPLVAALADGTLVASPGLSATPGVPVWTSSDAGATWARAAAFPGPSPPDVVGYFSGLRATPADGLILVGSACAAAGSGWGCAPVIRASTDGGVTWSVPGSPPALPTNPPAPFELGPLAALGEHGVLLPVSVCEPPVTGGTTLATCTASLWRSEDLGATWSVLAVEATPEESADHLAWVTALPDGGALATGQLCAAGQCRAGVWSAAAGDDQMRLVASGGAVPSGVLYDAPSGRVLGGGRSILYTDDGGAVWRDARILAVLGDDLAVSGFVAGRGDDLHAYGSSDGVALVLRSSDGGLTWTDVLAAAA